ncbi:MAG: SRPBCC family protein [Paracoccaceae bacterium]|nr:SRPBCC family protein [Paracoccaceae bacterium]MDE3123437.1 SRPBCC family protein [Paracoccaceae bacterium]MDE3237905.1 SRPBCC family protein [Paracoccaceae bacterium]
MNTQAITIEATIDAPVETVWTCFTEPAHITQWNFASDDWHCPSAENDLRVGGRCKTRMEAKDGSFGFDLEYVYDAVEPMALLAYRLMDGRNVRTTFAPMEGRTHVVTVFDPEGLHSLEQQREGWGQILKSFKRHAEAQRG